MDREVEQLKANLWVPVEQLEVADRVVGGETVWAVAGELVSGSAGQRSGEGSWARKVPGEVEKVVRCLIWEEDACS